jgi:hypothetical protein
MIFVKKLSTFGRTLISEDNTKNLNHKNCFKLHRNLIAVFTPSFFFGICTSAKRGSDTLYPHRAMSAAAPKDAPRRARLPDLQNAGISF